VAGRPRPGGGGVWAGTGELNRRGGVLCRAACASGRGGGIWGGRVGGRAVEEKRGVAGWVNCSGEESRGDCALTNAPHGRRGAATVPNRHLSGPRFIFLFFAGNLEELY
jgi:hypothetical protein